jgi:hypothetical protein
VAHDEQRLVVALHLDDDGLKARNDVEVRLASVVVEWIRVEGGESQSQHKDAHGCLAGRTD